MDIFSRTRKAIETRFNDWWAANAGGVPVGWENAAFDQGGAGHFARFSIGWADGAQASLGSRPLEFQNGMVFVQIFDNKNAGTRRSAALADVIARGMRYQQLTEGDVVVDLYTPQIIPVEDRIDYYQINVRIQFRAQHVTLTAG